MRVLLSGAVLATSLVLGAPAFAQWASPEVQDYGYGQPQYGYDYSYGQPRVYGDAGPVYQGRSAAVDSGYGYNNGYADNGGQPGYSQGYGAPPQGYAEPAYRSGYGSGYADNGQGGAPLEGRSAAVDNSVAGAGSEDQTSYCQSRFRSYNPATGTYLGFDGVQHSCP